MQLLLIKKRASAEWEDIMPIKKKKYSARFPPARIKKIMQTDEDVGKVAAPVPVIISRALELFVENLLKKANQVTLERGARTLTPSHLKMCIKSEKRFDFLKELVSTVPDLQGDHDEPLALYQSMTTANTEAAATQNNKNDTSNPSQRLKLPRQLSTPRPRGRPRAISADQDQPIPKKRKKKRQPKFMDEVDDNELSDFSNPEADVIGDTTSTTAVVPNVNHTSINNANAIVTCTVTTGLTSPNGVNNGSKLGFTISIPSSSLSTPLTTLTSQNGSSGTSTSSLQSFTTSKASSTEQSSSVSVSAADQDIKLALMVNNDPTSGSVQDVDENYDDC